MRPHGIPAVDPAGVAQRGPEVGRVPHPPRAQLEADQGREGRLRRTATGPGPAYGLGQGTAGRHPVRGGLGDHLVHPAFDQRQHGLEPLQHRLLRRRLLRLEQATTLQGLAQLGEVAGVELTHRLLESGGVDRDAARILLDQGQHLLPQPARGGEQPLPGALPQRQVQRDVTGRLFETLAERLDVGRQQRDVAGFAQRQPDVGRADHLGRQLTQALAELQAEHAGPGGPQHRPEHLLHPGQPGRGCAALRVTEGQGALHRVGDVRGDRLHQPAPDRHGLLDPLRPAPGRDPGADLGKRRRLVQPELGQRDGVRDRPLLPAVRTRVGTERGDRTSCGVLGHLPVDPGAGRRRAAAEHPAGAAEHGEGALQLGGEGVHVATGQRGEERFERVRRSLVPTRGAGSSGAAETVRLGLPALGFAALGLLVGRIRVPVLRHHVLLTSGGLFASTVRAGPGTSGWRRGVIALSAIAGEHGSARVQAMASGVRAASITDAPLSVDRLLGLVSDPGRGRCRPLRRSDPRPR